MTGESRQRPEDVRFLSGVILVSGQPERLAGFYRDVLGLPLAGERHGDTAPHLACELGDSHFAIHPVADYQGEPTATGAVKLAFIIFDMTGLVQWLQTRGIPLCYPPAELGTQSRITAIRDPDGNLIELTELGPAWGSPWGILHICQPSLRESPVGKGIPVPKATSVTGCQVHICSGVWDTRLIEVMAACCRGSSRPRASITGPAGPAALL